MSVCARGILRDGEHVFAGGAFVQEGAAYFPGKMILIFASRVIISHLDHTCPDPHFDKLQQHGCVHMLACR